MRNFKNYFFAENIYRDKDTGKLVYKITPKEIGKVGTSTESNQQLVAKEIFLNTTIKGNMSTFIPTKQAKLFIGYDVYSTTSEEGKEIRNSVYAAVKGSSNLYKDIPYDKPFQAMPKEDYEMLMTRAVDAFINSVTAPYDFIVYPSSRSSNARDIAELIDTKLKAKFTSGIMQKRAHASKVQLISKKIVTPDTMKEVVQIGDLVNKAIIQIEQHIGTNVSTGSKRVLTDFLTKAVAEFLYNKAINVKDNTEFSTATHLRSTHNKTIFANALNELNSNNIVPEIYGKLTNLSINGHLDDFSVSHFDLSALIEQLKQYISTGKTREWIGATRILAVDDNINSGDMYKQLAPLGDILKYCDYFFLMKDMRYKI